MGQVFTFIRGRAVEYGASQNATSVYIPEVSSVRGKLFQKLFKLIPNVLLTNIAHTNRCFPGKKLGQSISSALER